MIRTSDSNDGDSQNANNDELSNLDLSDQTTLMIVIVGAVGTLLLIGGSSYLCLKKQKKVNDMNLANMKVKTTETIPSTPHSYGGSSIIDSDFGSEGTPRPETNNMDAKQTNGGNESAGEQIELVF